MKKLVLGTAFAAALIAGTSAQGADKDVLDWVDPFIGTQGTGHTTPAAACPFGMVQPGPDTSHAGWEHCSAYQYGDRRIERFSQNHLSGTGCSEFTDVGFMPFAGNFNAAWRRDCFQKIDKATEKASPGYYAVTLDTGVRVEMTCTERVAIYRITYLKAPAHLLFDPSWSFRTVQSVDFAPMKDGKVDIDSLEAIAFDPYTHGYYKVGGRVGEAFKDGAKLK